MRPHVLTLIDSLAEGGAERVAVELATGADPRRFRRSLCITRGSLTKLGPGAGASLERLRDAEVEVFALERHSRTDVRAWARLLSYLREHVDVVHAHKFGSNFWGAVLGRAARVPVVLAHEHTWSFEGRPVRRQLDRRVIARLADLMIAVSDADQQRMIEVVGIPAERIVVMPNGIPSWPAGDGIRFRQECGIAPGAPVLAMTAVLRPQKAVDVMVEALAIVRRSVPAVRLLVIGQGDPSPLMELADRLGVGEAVGFLGHRPDVPEVLAAADLGVLSSDFEGSPLAVLEYMAAGLPVVATDVGGVPSIVQHGRTGLLVPRRDPPALAAAIETVLSDRELARSMGERGRSRQLTEYSSEAMCERVYELYERLLERKRHSDVQPELASKQGA